MSKLKDIPSGSVELKPEVASRCPHCSKPNPVVQALQMGESSDSVMVGMVPSCCRKIISVQLIAKQPEVPIIN
jgi:hypothetical protein